MAFCRVLARSIFHIATKVRSSYGQLAYFYNIFMSGKNVVFSTERYASGSSLERTLWEKTFKWKKFSLLRKDAI